MPSRSPAPDVQRPRPRLYLVVPLAAVTSGLADLLGQILPGADAAAVLIPPAGDDERTMLTNLKALLPVIQSADAAFLLQGHPDLVARSGADGAHLADIEQLDGALGSLKPQRIAGCGGLHTRHDAMAAAEAGADYVMFGEPDAAGRRPSFQAVLERVQWWAEVFEVPCVGFAGDLDEIGPLATAGADFIAASFMFDDPRGASAAIKDALGRLIIAEVAP